MIDIYRIRTDGEYTVTPDLAANVVQSDVSSLVGDKLAHWRR